MFADLLLPPTGCFDWYTLGWPASLIVFLAVTASLISAFVVLSRRFMRKPWALLLCLALFIAADLLVYFVGLAFIPQRRDQRGPPPQSTESEQK